MKPIRIIGVGSPFGQDQLGFNVISALEGGGFAEHFPPSLISLQRSDRPGAALLELFKGSTSVILIDAFYVPDNNRTFVRWIDTRELLHEPALFSSHNFGITEALQLGRVLGELPERLRILGIAMTGLHGHCAISPALYRDIATHLFDEICATCRQLNIDLPADLSPDSVAEFPQNGENS
jgi:hydrogenase maturation protease